MKKENSKTSVLQGAIQPHINENDAAALVGGIVEKGFSQPNPLGPPPAPRPSVLPFPVARHRSHGPHWVPKVVNSNANNDGDGDVGEDGEGKDFNGMELAAGVANPVPRKEKKGLDFSRWKEIMKKDSHSGLHEKKKGMGSTGVDVREKADDTHMDDLSKQIGSEDAALSGTSLGDHAEEQFMTIDDNDSSVLEDIKKVNGGLSNNGVSESEGNTGDKMESKQLNGSSKEIDMVSEREHMPINHVASGFAAQKLVREEEGSLESQIDAENRARLSSMSVDEIAEAQAEIEKLKPELLNALRKRGQAKAKRQKFSLSEVSETDSLQPDKKLSKLTVSSDNTRSHEPVKKVAGDAETQEDNRNSPNVSKENRGMWDAWSKRVEAVRDLRFSLDGSVINSDFAHVSDSDTGYSANNVSERDFLRTEGNPGAAGYTIKEAIALTRSVVPGQRTLALQLIAAILDRAIANICHNEVGGASKFTEAKGSVDWEAIWAFALGPEPELVLSLRMSLDDNHNYVVLACAKAMQCVLSYEMNEIIFDIAEKTPTFFRDVCTAPVFRSKPDINVGFLRGGFWKYNTKPNNITHFDEESMGDKSEDERTIQDDIAVAGQDIAAGLVRMGILPRICYLLETDPAVSLEECLISILIAIARHSPTCAAAIVNCERLVHTVANRFSLEDQMEINACKIKSVILLKVLARHEKKCCSSFIQNGLLHKVTWHLYRYPISLDHWFKSGRDACKLSSALLVEQLRLWKVCIQYGYCISDSSELFTSLCNWLSVPTIDKLIKHGVMNEYCAVTKEAYLLLEVLARRLPNFYSHANVRMEGTDEDKESWSWNHFGSIIDLAVEWIKLKSIPYVSKFFDCHTEDSGDQSLQDTELNSLLWVISSVLNMLNSLLKAVIPDDTRSLPAGHLKWLPDFVPRVGFEIIRNGYLRFSELSDTICKNPLSENGSVVEYLCGLRLVKSKELAICSTCCLQGLVQVVVSVDKLIQLANIDVCKATSKHCSREDKVLANGIFKSSVFEAWDLLTNLMKLVNSEWHCMQSIEMFGRGGPAPGVGVGWGASGGGYWSLKTLLAQQDVILLNYMVEISKTPAKDPSVAEETGFILQKLNCALAACLIVGPGNSNVIDRLLNAIFQVPVLKCLDIGIREFLTRRKGSKPFGWNYEENEYLLLASVLATHFSNRWLGVKKKKKTTRENNNANDQTSKKGSRALATIHEEIDTNGEESTTLVLEWARHRLHLPSHWFLSAISMIPSEIKACPPGASFKENCTEVPSNFLEVVKGGLFFLLGIEAIPTFFTSETYSPVQYVPVVWKLHALSVILLSGMDVLQDEKSRDVYEILQNLYGEIIDGKTSPLGSLCFKSDIHDNYSTFVETLVDQFAAESYGDILFGRQVAVYLHRSVEASLRLATWNALSNARVLELLPTLDKCFTKAEGYLEPIEDDEKILEAYVKSWVSGALDKAATRNSMTSSLVLHHLSSFIFGNVAGEMLSLRNKLTKSLLRDYCRKKQHEDMMVRLICYKKPDMTLLPICEIEKRLQLLKEICEGNSSLVTAGEELESCIRRDLLARMS